MKKILAGLLLGAAVLSATPAIASNADVNINHEHSHATIAKEPVGIPCGCGGTYTYRGNGTYKCTGCGDSFSVR